MYILPAAEYSADNYQYASLSCSSHLIMAYGPAAYLRHAFISGCRDFIREPWTAEEMYYRILQQQSCRINGFSWNSLRFTPFSAATDTDWLSLSKQEYTIMYVLNKQLGTAVSRSTLALAVWGKDRPASRAVDMQISSLRKKLKSILRTSKDFIHTIHGEGYLLK